MDFAPSHLVVAPVLIPLLIGALLLFFDERERRLKRTLSLVSAAALLGVAVSLLTRVHAGGDALALVYLVGDWPAPIAINLVADRLSAIMLALTAILAICAIIFSIGRWEKAGPHFHSLMQFLLAGVSGAFLTGDLFNLFVFIEVMLAASYGLVLHGGGQGRVRAGLHYIAINLAASLIFLVGIAMIFGAAGTLNMAELSVRAGEMDGFAGPALATGLAMLGLAFLVKAGMWPLCHWLVPAYSAAAGPVAAMFAILSKVGVYAILRMTHLMPGEEAAFGSTVIFLGGAATLIFGSIGLIASQSMKRAGAYLVLVSSGTLLAAFGMSVEGGTAGGLFYLVSSTLAVSAFFLMVELLEREQGAGSDVLAVTLEAYAEAEAGEESEEADPGVVMPGAVAALGIGFGLLALVLIGLPPLSGFLAKFAILTAVMGPGSPAAGWETAVLASLLVLSGLFALVALARMGIRTFWAPVEPLAPRITLSEAAPICALMLALGLLVFQAGPAVDLFAAAAADLHDPARYLEAVMGAERVAEIRDADT
ncbi:monovalent cation/H+ antiporter subunit D [Glycocaulis profundi]|nr:monovalent cation/H+ antiporter subunit D [Glycocaulis profundi]